MYITIAIVATTVGLLVWGRFRADMVTLYAFLALMVLHILTPAEALSGFSSNVIFVTGGMFIISGAIVRSGLASVLSKRILAIGGRNARILFTLIMILTAIIGSLVSNTGTIAIMMPIVVSVALSIDESPSRFLMPLAFMSSIGGMFTLVGNSSNMVVNDAYIRAGYPSLTLFSFFPIGLVCFLFGMAVLSPVCFYLLSRRKNEKTGFRNKNLSIRGLLKKHNLTGNFFRVEVPGGSPIIGQSLFELCLTEKYHLVIQEISRCEKGKNFFGFKPHSVQIIPDLHTVIRAGDVLGVLGTKVDVDSIVEDFHLKIYQPGQVNNNEAGLRCASIGMCELVVMSTSPLVNRSVASAEVRERYGITVLSIHRGDQYIFENIRDQVVQAGDALLVQGPWEKLSRLDSLDANWVVVGSTRDLAASNKLYHKIPLVAGVLAFMVATTAFNVLPTVVAVLLSAMLLISGGCFRNMREVYTSIGWDTLVVLSCMFSIAFAMEKTGIIDIVSTEMRWVGQHYGPYVALAVIYAVASCMNIFISTTPVALLISPIAVQVAVDMGLNPLPFVFAVTTAASMCFASPFSTPSNNLVMSTGRYTFFDYLKIGLPMQVLMGVVMVPAIPLMFPFSATTLGNL